MFERRSRMSTKNVVAMNPVEPAKPAKEPLRRPPQPPERLKAERVQELLKAMPGWKLGPGGRVISRRREFDSPQAAAAFAGFVSGLASGADRAVRLDLSGSMVVVTLPGRAGEGSSEDLSLEILGFAQQIG
jgi:hypothetical protein